MSAGG
jgi:hypothetical protein